jgi:hypothetical protein
MVCLGNIELVQPLVVTANDFVSHRRPQKPQSRPYTGTGRNNDPFNIKFFR